VEDLRRSDEKNRSGHLRIFLPGDKAQEMITKGYRILA
jgi:hypothetical protein